MTGRLPFFQAVIDDRPHPEQGIRTYLGILALTKSYGNARVDAACQRGILIKLAPSPRSVQSSRTALIALSSTRRRPPTPAPRQHPR